MERMDVFLDLIERSLKDLNQSKAIVAYVTWSGLGFLIIFFVLYIQSIETHGNCFVYIWIVPPNLNLH